MDDCEQCMNECRRFLELTQDRARLDAVAIRECATTIYTLARRLRLPTDPGPLMRALDPMPVGPRPLGERFDGGRRLLREHYEHRCALVAQAESAARALAIDAEGIAARQAMVRALPDLSRTERAVLRAYASTGVIMTVPDLIDALEALPAGFEVATSRTAVEAGVATLTALRLVRPPADGRQGRIIMEEGRRVDSLLPPPIPPALAVTGAENQAIGGGSAGDPRVPIDDRESASR